MENTKVGTREFRVGLAEYIASDKPVAVTRHEAVMPLGDGEVDALAALQARAQSGTTAQALSAR